jgi:hypothetical protein
MQVSSGKSDEEALVEDILAQRQADIEAGQGR